MNASIVIAVAACLAAAALSLQAAAPAGAQAASMPCAGAASASMGGCGTSPGGARRGPHSGGHPAMPGAMPMSLMTPEEQAEHRQRMGTFKSFEECQAYVDDLRQKLAQRARERGVATSDMPMHDTCGGLPRLKP